MLFQGALRGDRPRDVIRRSTIIAIISFLTLIDLFGAQALLPQIIVAYKASAGLAGVAVNAATLGMAVSGITVAWFADRIDRKRGIWICLALLSIPTALLCLTDDIWVFMALRVIQGTLMAAAFTLTMTYLSEQCEVMAIGGALAAYITGNVASNLFGRLAAVAMAGATGLSGTFIFFAALNIAGAVFAYVMIGPRDGSPPKRGGSPLAAWRRHFAVPSLRATFGIGFLILFIFVGVFTYVNLYLVKDVGLAPMSLGLVYLIFAPAIITTPLAANQVKRYGSKRAMFVSLGAVLGGMLLTLSSSVWIILCGLSIIGMAIFFAQAAATGYLSKSVTNDRAQANGLYLTSYYLGGLMGAIILGQINMANGWLGTAAALGAVILVAMSLALYIAD
jgi:MFS transporter, YNFM family, putative membrane transport protein